MNEVAKPIDPIEQFKESLQAKLRDQIGELMPPEMLKKLIEDSVQSILYESNKPYSGYGERPLPWIKETVRTAIDAQIKSTVDQVISERKEEVLQTVLAAIKDDFPTMIAKILIQTMVQNNHTIAYEIANNMRNLMQR